MLLVFFFFFFFSSRRRHTRFDCDWSSDVCSSDLSRRAAGQSQLLHLHHHLQYAVLDPPGVAAGQRSEEHTSELQSQSNLVCRLLLEKKKNEQSSASKESKLISHILRHYDLSNTAL